MPRTLIFPIFKSFITEKEEDRINENPFSRIFIQSAFNPKWIIRTCGRMEIYVTLGYPNLSMVYVRRTYLFFIISEKNVNISHCFISFHKIYLIILLRSCGFFCEDLPSGQWLQNQIPSVWLFAEFTLRHCSNLRLKKAHKIKIPMQFA